MKDVWKMKHIGQHNQVKVKNAIYPQEWREEIQGRRKWHLRHLWKRSKIKLSKPTVKDNQPRTQTSSLICDNTHHINWVSYLHPDSIVLRHQWKWELRERKHGHFMKRQSLKITNNRNENTRGIIPRQSSVPWMHYNGWQWVVKNKTSIKYKPPYTN